MSKFKQQVLVAGATGKTGNIIIELLKKSDIYEPVAMVRKVEQRDKFENDKVKTVLADLENEINHATKNISKVIFAAGSGGAKTTAVDQNGAIRLIDAASKDNIEKFVMLSSMGADRPSENEELKEYLNAKQKADNHLRESGMNYTIVRPGALNNNKATHKIELATKLNKSGEIPRADVAQTLVDTLENNIRKNEIIEILEGEDPIETAIKQ